MNGGEWRVQRDARSGDSRCPHRLMADWCGTMRLTDEAADAIEPLLPFLNGVRPLPASGPPVFLLLDVWQALGLDSEAFHGWWAADPSFPDRWSQILAAIKGDLDVLAEDTNPPAGVLLDLLVAQVNGTTTPADDLPAGVHRIDGRLWLEGREDVECPDGYRALGVDGAWRDAHDWNEEDDDRGSLGPDDFLLHPLRPVQQPDTETIDTRLAKGRTLPDGRQIVVTGDDDLGPWFIIAPVGDRNHAAEVTVLKDGGRS